MFVPDVAEYFQKAGITVLTYDPRSLGLSDGIPRNDIDPWKSAEDYHDALTFLKTQPIVDSERIGYWGFSFAGMVSLTAAALDKRAKLVIAVCPLTDFTFPAAKWPKVLAKAQQDRESRLKGNDVFYLPALTEKGENPTGFGNGTAKEDFNLILMAKTIAPRYENRTTVQTYYRISAWHPFKLMPLVSPTPVMIVTAENDQISLAANQVKLFETFSEPKQLEIVPNKTHMDALSGDDFERVMQLQVDFVRRHMGE
jgi:pimeloyl-ACP methyl ester carboxylesterase